MKSDSTTPNLSFHHKCSLFPSWASWEQVDVIDKDRFFFYFSPDFLSKPSLSAWPNAVASENSNVTLKCVSPMPGIRLVLRKGDKILDSRLPHHLTEGTAEFRLTNLRLSHAGHYTCEYYLKESPDKISLSSDVLILLVTGEENLPQSKISYFQTGMIVCPRECSLGQKRRHLKLMRWLRWEKLCLSCLPTHVLSQRPT